MKAIPAILSLLIAAGVTGGSVDILSETPCPVEMTWSRIRIDGWKLLESGGMRLLLNRGFPFDTESWTIDIDPDGSLLSCEEVTPGNRLVYSTAPASDSYAMSLIACDLDGDTVWTCVLQETDSDFFNSPTLTELSEGGWVVDSRPDCNTMCTEIQRISSIGEMVWHNSLGTDFLLEPDGPVGEVYPFVTTFGETPGGDILAGGSVSQLMNTPDAWFICLLDGDTGEPLWKVTGFALGEAGVQDVTETSEGSIVAVGETAVSFVPEGMAYAAWGPKRPFIAVLDSDGTLIDFEVFELNNADSFEAVIEYDSGRDYIYDSVVPPREFIVAGVDTTSSELVLVRLRISKE